jgi:hypothetical protein
MANLAGKEIYKYAFRVEVFLKKYTSHDPFTLVNGKKVTFVVNNNVVNALKNSQPTTKLELLDTKGDVYKFKDLQKTDEFGGKGAGGSTIKEDRELASLRKQIADIKVKEASSTVSIKVGRTIYEVEDAESTPGSPKSDFHLLDKNGKECVWISHKDGKGPRDFQQWGGISNRKEPKVFNHPETQQFIEDLKKIYPDGLPRATSLHRKIKDNKLKMIAVYGNEYGRAMSRQNTSILIQGPVELVKKSNYYVFKSNHIHYNGDSVDADGFEPVFMAIYKGDRSDAGVKGTRIVIMPIQGRKSKEFDTDLNIK